MFIFFSEVMSSTGLLQPILMPKVYPALFDLYALHCDKDDEKYWERVQKLNKQGDMSLMAYLGIDQYVWRHITHLFLAFHFGYMWKPFLFLAKDGLLHVMFLEAYCCFKSINSMILITLLHQNNNPFCQQSK